ncbi:XdhC family protein [Streptomyces sp. NP160]|uniref:XdhC family protein n=1 Tax=Streptomyces sp. NP160 TaxID=2586637 RepID=UPI00214A8CD8|nr:XdhC/CoxI family protein [Streptomyces sp. NP160]
MTEGRQDVSAWAQPYALATVIRTWNSAPRPAGAAMAVSAAGQVYGSVSGGCVESDVFMRCQEVIATGRPATTTYGVSDDDAMQVGLSCGGSLTVFMQRVDPRTSVWHERLTSTATATATVVDGPGAGAQLVLDGDTAAGTLGDDGLDRAVVAEALRLAELGGTQLIHRGAHGQALDQEVTVFIEATSPPPRLIVFGAVDFTTALAEAGRFVGFHVTVCDARDVFTSRTRFPAAHDVVVDWPHRYLQREADAGRVDARTAIAVLTHDPRFDVPVLQVAARLPQLAYIGAMGSRRTHDDRLARLREAGLQEDDLRRLRSPIGLDIGARTPQETAISIIAEVIAEGAGRAGRPLVFTAGRIHSGAA